MAAATISFAIVNPCLAPPLLKQQAGLRRSIEAIKENDSRGLARYRDYFRNVKRSCYQSLDWSCDGRLLLALGKDEVRLLDAETMKEERQWSADFQAAQMDPTNRNVLTLVSYGGKLSVWDVRDSKAAHDVELTKFNSSMTEFVDLAWNPKGDTVALQSKTDHVFIVDVRGITSTLSADGPPSSRRRATELLLMKTQTIPCDNREINSLAFSPTGEHLWFGLSGTPGVLKRYRTPSINIKEGNTMTGHHGSVLTLCADPGGRYMVSGGADGIIGLWDATTCEQVDAIDLPEGGVNSLSVNFDGSLVAWVTGQEQYADKFVNVCHVDTKTLLWSDDFIRQPISNVKFSPTNLNRLAYTTYDEDRTDGAHGMLGRDHFRGLGPFRHRGDDKNTAQIHIVRIPNRD